MFAGFHDRGFSAWATHWATSDAARSGRARPASAVARGAGGPGGPDALVGLPGGPWRPRPATCPALLAQLFGCTQSESLSLTRGSERLPTSGRLGHIAGIPCARQGRLNLARGRWSRSATVQGSGRSENSRRCSQDRLRRDRSRRRRCRTSRSTAPGRWCYSADIPRDGDAIRRSAER